MKDPQSNHNFLEKYRKVISENKEKKQKALWRGLIFLALLGLVTYIGKLKPPEVKIVSSHGLLGWVFLADGQYSLLLILPNDGDDENQIAMGERVYFNPHPDPGFLDSNHIRYNAHSLYLLGNTDSTMVSRYCSKVDSGYSLYFEGPAHWGKDCSLSKNVLGSAFSLFEDMALEAKVNWDSNAAMASLSLRHQGQYYAFVKKPSLCDSLEVEARFCLALEPGPAPLTAFPLSLSPDFARVKAIPDTNLLLTSPQQTLGFRVLEGGEIKIKKLWLKEMEPLPF